MPIQRVGQTESKPLESGGFEWLRAPVVVAMSAPRVSVVQLSALTPTVIARADPTRSMIGFALSSPTGITVTAWPSASITRRSWIAVNGGIIQWFSISDVGPVVCLDWLALDSASGTVEVWEIYRTRRC